VNTRNPKAEGRTKPESRKPKAERAPGSRPAPTRSFFGLRASVFLGYWLLPIGYFRPLPRTSAPLPKPSCRLRASAFVQPSDFGLRISAALFVFLLPHLAFAASTNAAAPEPIPRLRPARGEIPPTFWEQYGAWVILASVVLLGVLGFIVWRMTRPKPAEIVPPDAQARKALGPLRGKPEDGALLSQVSQVLRHYVGAAFGLPPGEMTTAEFCRAVAAHERLGNELSAALADFLRKCDERKFAPPASTVAVSPLPSESPPAASAPQGTRRLDAVAQASRLIELAEARRAQTPPVQQPAPAPHGPQAYRGASKS